MILYLDTSYSVSGMKRYTLQALTSVTIPAGTTTISWGKYWGCPFTSITIPATVTSIGIDKH